MSATAPPVQAPARTRTVGWSDLVALQKRFPAIQLGATIAVFAVGAATLDGFTSAPSLKLMLVLAALAGIAALGQTLLILMGGFDLSIAGLAVGTGLIVTQIRGTWEIGFVPALLVALVGAAAFGAVAGQICHRLQIQPLIVTLATGAIALGLVQTQAPVGIFGAEAPGWLIDLASPAGDTLGVGIPPLVVIWVLAAIAMSLFLHRTVGGRHVMATGANPRAAEYSLISTRRVWTIAFVFSAVVSVFLGLAITGFGGSITTTSGSPYLFLSVVVVILGGTTFGGPGDYGRTVVGALFVTIVNLVLVGHGATQADQQIVLGIAMLVVMTAYGRQRRIRDRV
jgi:ribose transport system permease protein